MSLASAAAAQQSNLKTYYVNDGRSNTYDSSGAELQVDLGGFIPFSRYEEIGPGGHAYAVPYDAGGFSPPKFRDLMKKHGLDLYELDAALDATVVGLPPANLPTILPFGSRVQVDPELLTYNALPIPDLPFPLEFDAWWSCTSGGVTGSGKRKVLMWPYRINGGAMMICMASDGNREIARREPAEASSILLVNYSFHWRHLGTNKNRWREAGPGVEYARQFSGPSSGAFMTQDGGRYSTGQEILGIQAQAIEDGASSSTWARTSRTTSGSRSNARRKPRPTSATNGRSRRRRARAATALCRSPNRTSMAARGARRWAAR